MKIKKRFLMTLLAVALVIAALAMPAFALSSTMTYDSASGTIGTGSAAINWGTTLGASTSQAIATVTTSHNMILSVSMSATVIVRSQIYYNSGNDAVTGTQATASVTNVVFGVGTGTIQSVTATYVAGTTSLKPLTVS